MIAKKIKQTNIIKYNDNCIIIKIWWQFEKIPNIHIKKLKMIHSLNLKVEFEAHVE